MFFSFLTLMSDPSLLICFGADSLLLILLDFGRERAALQIEGLTRGESGRKGPGSWIPGVILGASCFLTT